MTILHGALQMINEPDFNALTFEQVQEIETQAYVGMADNGHSLVSPSGYHSWGRCSGYVNGIHHQRATGSDNMASVEGTAGHILLEICLTLLIDPMSFNPSCEIPKDILFDIRKWATNVSSKMHNPSEVRELAITLANNLIDREMDMEFMVEIKKVTDVVYWYMHQGYTMIPEARVSIFDYFWHKASDGTSDIVLYNEATKHIIIADLKYGMGIEVFPKENGQLLIYCLGVLSFLAKQGLDVQNYKISIVVAQPRISNRYWDEWITDYNFMLQFSYEAKAKSVKALYAIAYPQVVTIDDYNPSVSACRFCSHKTNCQPRAIMVEDELTRVLSDSGIVLSGDLTPTPINSENTINDLVTSIPSSKLVQLFKATPFISALLVDVESEMNKRMKAGNKMDGVKLVYGKNARKWDFKDDEFKTLLEKHGIADIAMISKLPSPAQFEKIPKKSVDNNLRDEIMSHVVTFTGKPKLALENDKRKSIDEVRELASQEALADAGIVVTT